MLILIVHSKSVILIILSLQLEYYELYCLDLGDYFLFARVEILNLPNKFLFVNNRKMCVLQATAPSLVVPFLCMDQIITQSACSFAYL